MDLGLASRPFSMAGMCSSQFRWIGKACWNSIVACFRATLVYNMYIVCKHAFAPLVPTCVIRICFHAAVLCFIAVDVCVVCVTIWLLLYVHNRSCSLVRCLSLSFMCLCSYTHGRWKPWAHVHARLISWFGEFKSKASNSTQINTHARTSNFGCWFCCRFCHLCCCHQCVVIPWPESHFPTILLLPFPFVFSHRNN